MQANFSGCNCCSPQKAGHLEQQAAQEEGRVEKRQQREHPQDGDDVGDGGRAQQRRAVPVQAHDEQAEVQLVDGALDNPPRVRQVVQRPALQFETVISAPKVGH